MSWTVLRTLGRRSRRSRRSRCSRRSFVDLVLFGGFGRLSRFGRLGKAVGQPCRQWRRPVPNAVGQWLQHLRHILRVFQSNSALSTHSATHKRHQTTSNDKNPAKTQSEHTTDRSSFSLRCDPWCDPYDIYIILYIWYLCLFFAGQADPALRWIQVGSWNPKHETRRVMPFKMFKTMWNNVRLLKVLAGRSWHIVQFRLSYVSMCWPCPGPLSHPSWLESGETSNSPQLQFPTFPTNYPISDDRIRSKYCPK